MKEIDRFERLKSKLEHTRKSLIDEGFELDGLGIMENYDVLNPYVHGYSKAVLSEFPQFETINEALCGYDLFSEFADGELNDSNAIDWVVDKVRCACESVEEEKKDELVEAKQLNEGTSNFYGDGGADFLPLLVFMDYETVYDAAKDAAKFEYDEDEDGDWDEYLEAFMDEHFDEYSNGVCTLDEWEVEELNDDLYDMTKRINDKGSKLYYEEDEDTSLRGEILKDIEFEIKPGYYEGAQIFIDFHGNEEYLNDEDKEELAQCFEELKKKHGLTEMAIAWGPASNGETGYKIVEAKEEKPQEEKKTYAIAVRYVENGDFDILTYETKEEMEDAYEKAKNSYLINGREWDDISLDVFGACEDEEGKIEEGLDEPPTGYEKFKGNLDNPYQRIEVGKKVITKDGEEYFITDVDEMDRSYLWVSKKRSNIASGIGHSLHKGEVEFISKETYESLKKDDEKKDKDHECEDCDESLEEAKHKSVDEFEKKYVGKHVTFTHLDEYDEEEMPGLKDKEGESCEIVSGEILDAYEDGGFSYCYWNVKFDDGSEYDGIPGKALRLHKKGRAVESLKEENQALVESRELSFEDLFWWIYGDEDPLKLGVQFKDTYKLIEDKFADIVWEKDDEPGDPERLSEEQRQEILDSARDEAESWTSYDLYGMPARYVNTFTIYKGLKKLLGAECDRLDESLKGERHMSDGPLQLGEDRCINESEENEIKAILKPRLTQDGQIKPFADDEKLPRGFRFLASTSGVNQRGYVRYKGNRYWFEVKDGEDGKDIAVIRESIYDRKSKQVGHVNTNAGDVEKNMAAFNHSMMGEGIEDDAVKTSLKNQIGDNVKDEIDAIDNYDGLTDAINFCGSISEEDKAKLLAIVDDIRSEEYKHVGQLSKAVDVVDSKAADDVAKGHEEGVEQADSVHGEEHAEDEEHVEDEKEEVVEIEG